MAEVEGVEEGVEVLVMEVLVLLGCWPFNTWSQLHDSMSRTGRGQLLPSTGHHTCMPT